MTQLAAAIAPIAAVAVNKMSITTRRLIGFLILIGAFVAAFFLVQFFIPKSSAPETGNRSTKVPETLVLAVRMGDFQTAVSENRAIQDNPNKSSEEKAVAAYNALGSQYRATADTSARILDVQNMKKVILDKTVSLSTRVGTLDVLTKQYYIAGRDPAVFAEIYKDAPFDSYLAPGDPDLSARHLAEWAYGMMPTSNSAITIARWYSEQRILNPKQSTSTTNAYLDIAEDYLKKADAASLQESKSESSYSNSRRYLFYRYWKAMIVARLAGQEPKREPYQTQYREEFERFIAFAKTQQNVIAKEFLQYGHLFFSARLVRDNDTVAAKKQLDELAQELNATENLDTNVFMEFLKNEYKYRPTGVNWLLVKNMSGISPNFKAAVEKVIGSTLK